MSHDLTGETFGRLTVLEKAERPKDSSRKLIWWKCQCLCGKQVNVCSSYLLKGTKRSCNCLQDQSRKSQNGLSHSKIYSVYRSMLNRCNKTYDKAYKNYGGRGIKVCEEWKNNFLSFYDWSMNNGYREGLTIERINNDGDYSPSNCKWTTRREQLNNTRRNKFIEYKGEKKTISQWSETIGLPRYVLAKRIKMGWEIEKAMFTPVFEKYSNKGKEK